jgi:Domain of unknown function (DUF5107)
MSPALIQSNASINSLRAIQMENEWLALSILPDVGAKIYDLIWKPTGRNILWHNPRVLPQTFAIEANFDNYWCGGWDEGFPTCDACEYKGEMYPNLGELRSVRWNLVSAGVTAAIWSRDLPRSDPSVRYSRRKRSRSAAVRPW